MVKTPDLTLGNVKQSAKLVGGRVYQASDFMTKDERLELQKRHYTAKSSRPKRFDQVDALVAEILARFGWETYKAWQNGELTTERMVRLLCAERARARAEKLSLEAILLSMIGACVQKPKSGGIPRGVRNAHKIYKEEVEIAKGVK